MTLSVGGGGNCIGLSQLQRENKIVVEWYIGDDKELYKYFHSKRNEIESEIGASLEWNELPDKKASRILISKEVDLDNREMWSSQFDWMMEMALKFKKVFKQNISK